MKQLQFNHFLLFVFCLIFLESCFLRKRKQTKIERINEIVEQSKKSPVEEITGIKEISDFLDDYNIYVSLTTSPKRIDKVKHVLDTLDLSLLEKIYITLPEKYSRSEETYDIPNELSNYEKVEILRITDDLGPITKLIPAAKQVKLQGEKEAIIITVDDDTAYPIGMISQIIKALILNNKSVAGASVHPISSWNLDSNYWPDSKSDLLIEGYGAIGYKLSNIDSERMLNIISKQKEIDKKSSCFLSDDLVINYVLASNGIERIKIDNKYFGHALIQQFSYGFQEDALHRETNADGKVENINHKKYSECYDFIIRNNY